MDTLASLALATEPPDRAKLLDREPQSKTEYIVSQLMWKHIFFGALLQICVLFPMIFAGEHWIPNYDNDGTVENGRLYYYGGKKNYYDENDENPSEQFTVIFHLFVMFQLFNQFNARKIKDEINIFEQLTKSTLFLIIWVIEFLM
jgi:magnesium-transporting ATPase (P-type)